MIWDASLDTFPGQELLAAIVGAQVGAGAL